MTTVTRVTRVTRTTESTYEPVTGNVRPGVRIGVDVGSVRVGIAASDVGATVVLPVATLPRDGATVAAIVALVRERSAVEVVVGLPLGLAGREGPAAASVRAFAGELAAATAPVPLRLVDERFSTASATGELQPSRGRPGRSSAAGSGRGRPRRGGLHVDSRTLRGVVDQQAAAVILRTALARESGTGSPAGEVVSVPGSTA